MAQQNLNLTSPPGRIVWGNLYEPSTTDFQGQPLVVKTGPNKGQARVDYAFGLAIPKTVAAWWDEPWGKQILGAGAAAFPQQYQTPAFAWKITDGDSIIPNKANKKPSDSEGFKGHWVLRLGSSFPPTLVSLIGSANGQTRDLMEKNAILPGYFVQVNFDVSGNNQAQNPGIYLNHRIVCLIAYGAVIRNGPDPNSVGFGATAAQLPAGASLTPPAGSFSPVTPAPVAAPLAPAMVAPPAAVISPPAAIAAPPAGSVVAPAPVVVAPVPVAVLAPPPPPAAVAGPTMTALAGGQPYSAYIAAGWTDAQLRASGYMI